MVPPQPERRAQVLIADDDPGVPEVLRMALERDGYRGVERVPDGGAALERIGSGGVDVLVCDLRMPGIGGREVVRLLERRSSAPRVVVVSAHIDRDEADALRALDVVSDVLIKPFGLGPFVDAVGRAAASAAGGEGSEAGAESE